MSTRSGSNSALLVIDVQVGVVADAWDRERIIGNMAVAVERARQQGTLVIWVQHEAEDLKRDDDLNTAMRWLSYPGRTNTVASAAEVTFGAVTEAV